MKRALYAMACMVILFSGCASRDTTPSMTAPADEAAAVWEKFEAYSRARSAEQGPFRIQANLRYDNQGEGQRVTAVIWGNGDLPLRLDILAMGTVAGRIRQDQRELIIHSPREEKAWTHQGTEQAFLAFGLPIPLSLQDITALLQGRYLDVFGPVQGDFPLQEGNNFRFNLVNGKLPGTVTLTRDGLLTRWQEGPGGWALDVSYEGTPPLPQTLELRHPESRHAIITVTDRDRPERFSDTQLALALPNGTVVESLRSALR